MRPKRPLTARQTQVLDVIREYIRHKQRPPTLRELGEQLNIKSTNGVREHLIALVHKRWIRMVPGVARGIEVLP